MSKILLVAGHGVNDPGAVGGGINERDTMRALAKEIKSLIPDVVDIYDVTRDMFQDTNRGGGMYATKYKEVIELHMDASKNELVKGGHAIIYISYNPDDLDKRLVKTIDECFGIVPYLRPSGISKRNNLLNLNVAAKRGISYRLLELGFITNADNRKAVTGEQLKVTARKLAEAISNKKIEGTTSTVEGNEMNEKLGKTQQGDMRKLLTKAYQDKVFTNDHSPNVTKMTRGEALDLLISYTARTAK